MGVGGVLCLLPPPTPAQGGSSPLSMGGNWDSYGEGET